MKTVVIKNISKPENLALAKKYAKQNYNVVFIENLNFFEAKNIVLKLSKLTDGEIRFYKLLDGTHEEIEKINNYIVESLGSYCVLQD